MARLLDASTLDLVNVEAAIAIARQLRGDRRKPEARKRDAGFQPEERQAAAT
jgi:hypothetical protein